MRANKSFMKARSSRAFSIRIFRKQLFNSGADRIERYCACLMRTASGVHGSTMDKVRAGITKGRRISSQRPAWPGAVPDRNEISFNCIDKSKGLDMPVKLPSTPHGEEEVRGRILAKWNSYQQACASGRDADNLRGERYELTCAIYNYRKGRFTHGNQITRWKSDFDTSRGTAGWQHHIDAGSNTEFDFVFPSSAKYAGAPTVAGLILGDAKDITGNPLGVHVKTTLGFVLNNGLGGFCYQLPQNRIRTFHTLLFNVHAVLACIDGEQVPAIAGGQAWLREGPANGRPAGAAIQDYFRIRYSHLRTHNYSRIYAANPPVYYVNELAQYAGLVVLCDQVFVKNHLQLAEILVRGPF
ncbi:hypothetical protein LXA47_28465 [Massilia sp. P8910]|uniref:hypothetical protein n=1 Tax=Massilia antarctica TaxID=2765360 RepID=UPI001E2E8765|nr:hypothetical protein [Massilia antarctica]MCE3607507.1 hypothetical protein [Massilia antarctica]